MCGNDVSVIADPNEVWRNQFRKQVDNGEILISPSFLMQPTGPLLSPTFCFSPTVTPIRSSLWNYPTAKLAQKSSKNFSRTTFSTWKNSSSVPIFRSR